MVAQLPWAVTFGLLSGLLCSLVVPVGSCSFLPGCGVCAKTNDSAAVSLTRLLLKHETSGAEEGCRVHN